MPYYYFNEIWTPFKLIGIRLYKDEDQTLWVKIWHLKKRRLRS
ncbi:hypothetical protein COHCIP112018_03564 [Cohnella sp. JJ-181]|nr:hypothetical protein COHCIP112018_03564 [Cohnella sp. JJ-181]